MWQQSIVGGLMMAGVLAAQAEPLAELTAQVRATEAAFAQSMAERDLSKFGTFIADEAVFLNAKASLRGKPAVIAAWSGYFKDKEAPFAWQPERIEVLDSGTLAISNGPVYDSSGTLIARFNSIWRRESPGVWRIIFDKGEPPPPAALPANKEPAKAASGEKSTDGADGKSKPGGGNGASSQPAGQR